MNGFDEERIAADIWAVYESIPEQIGSPVANQAGLVDSMKRIIHLIERGRWYSGAPD